MAVPDRLRRRLHRGRCDSHPCRGGPKARAIPAWAEGPGPQPTAVQGLKARSIASLQPNCSTWNIAASGLRKTNGSPRSPSRALYGERRDSHPRREGGGPKARAHTSLGRRPRSRTGGVQGLKAHSIAPSDPIAPRGTSAHRSDRTGPSTIPDSAEKYSSAKKRFPHQLARSPMPTRPFLPFHKFSTGPGTSAQAGRIASPRQRRYPDIYP